ncbi:MAG: protein-disulfide reductase DsbD domain-containing protein [Verrucomicrobium sp.]|nr:protein-disulfide reductase DsbD domain-containing protein [Verrucomicrobium sp.]
MPTPLLSRLALGVLIACLCLPTGLRAQFGQAPKPVTAELVSDSATVAPGKPVKVSVKLVHQPTWHVYGKTIPEGATGLPTKVTWKLPAGWKVEDLPWPPTHKTESTGGAVIEAYEGTVLLPFQLTAPENLTVGSTVKLEGQVDALVCDPKSCMPVKLPISLELKAGEASAAAGSASPAPQVTEAAVPVSLAPAKAAKVTAELLAEVSTAAPGTPFKVAVKLIHQPTWHVYGKTIPEGATGLPTKVTWKLPEGWKVEDQPWPPTHQLKSTGGTLMEAYDGTVHLPFLITPPANVSAGGTVKLEGQVDALVCDPQSCMPVKMPISLEVGTGEALVKNEANQAVFASASATSPVVPTTVPAVEKASAETSKPTDTSAKDAVTPEKPAAATAKAPADTGSLASKLLLAFLGGLILNVMPCVFPVLGIKILSVVKQSGEDHRQILLHGLAYTLGVLVSFWAIAGLLIVLRSGGEQLGWGFQLQSPIFVLTLVIFLFAFGLNMAGLFEIGSSAVGIGSDLTRKSGLGGSFFSGLLATVVATPCAAPFLAPALTFALSLPAGPSLLFFTIIALGLAFPYLLLSAFPKLIGLLPRPGAWMESFKQAMSFLMFATVAFLLWTLAGMVSEYGLLKVFLGLVMVAVACWIYGRWSLPHKPSGTRVKAVVFTLIFFIGGTVLAWPDTVGKGKGASGKGDQAGITWKEWSPELVAQLRSEKKSVYIDFTARWCVTCQTNKLVYRDESLQNEFKRLNITTLKADWTSQDEVIYKAIQELGKAAIPVNVLYIPGKEEPLILPELLTVSNVKAALSELEKPVTATAMK